MATKWARQKAAQAWCTESTKKIVMNEKLCEAFADILDRETKREMLTKAYIRSFKKLQKDKAMTAHAESAGFVFEPKENGGEKLGFQIFVKLIRFSEALLKKKKDTGGLLGNL